MYYGVYIPSFGMWNLQQLAPIKRRSLRSCLCTEHAYTAYEKSVLISVYVDATNIRGLLMGKGGDEEKELVRIYLDHKEGVCLNEMMVEKKYAVFPDHDVKGK